jgi:hypothetical protein
MIRRIVIDNKVFNGSGSGDIGSSSMIESVTKDSTITVSDDTPYVSLKINKIVCPLSPMHITTEDKVYKSIQSYYFMYLQKGRLGPVFADLDIVGDTEADKIDNILIDYTYDGNPIIDGRFTDGLFSAPKIVTEISIRYVTPGGVDELQFLYYHIATKLVTKDIANLETSGTIDKAIPMQYNLSYESVETDSIIPLFECFNEFIFYGFVDDCTKYS